MLKHHVFGVREVQLTFLAYIFRVEYQHLMIVMSTYILDIFLLDSLPASDYKFSAKDILRNIFAERPTFSHPHLHNNHPTKLQAFLLTL